MRYREELRRAMALLAQRPETLFVGQSVRYGGQAMWPTFADVPMEKRIEMPVVEDFQMGFCTGLALDGYLPVCIFPRIDFLVHALGQLVNHLDKIPLYSGFRPKVIIRTAVGSTTVGLNPGPQHTQDHVEALRLMLKTVRVVDLPNAESVVPSYERATEHAGSTVLVEYRSVYDAE